MRAITKALLEDCPCQLLGAMIVWISPDKGKEVFRVWVQRDGKEGIPEVQDNEVGSGRGNEKEKSIGIWNYWVYGDNSCVDKSQVLDQVIGVIWLFDRQDMGVNRESELGARDPDVGVQ